MRSRDPRRLERRRALALDSSDWFPVVPCASTNFPTLMTAEKIAAAMMAE
jgi:hypothetical protein